MTAETGDPVFDLGRAEEWLAENDPQPIMKGEERRTMSCHAGHSNPLGLWRCPDPSHGWGDVTTLQAVERQLHENIRRLLTNVGPIWWVRHKNGKAAPTPKRGSIISLIASRLRGSGDDHDA